MRSSTSITPGVATRVNRFRSLRARARGNRARARNLAAGHGSGGPLLLAIDSAALRVFTIEIGLKIWLYRGRFFRGGWNIFDFTIVAIAWLPATGPLSVLRALRIIRVLRVVSLIPQMRAVVGALFKALPGMGSILAVLMLVFYIAAVMATNLFGESEHAQQFVFAPLLLTGARHSSGKTFFGVSNVRQISRPALRDQRAGTPCV